MAFRVLHAANPDMVSVHKRKHVELLSLSVLLALFIEFQAAEGDVVLLTDYGMATGILSESDFNVNVSQLDADFLSQYMDSSFTYFMMSR